MHVGLSQKHLEAMNEAFNYGMVMIMSYWGRYLGYNELVRSNDGM